ncbi:MAG: TrkH family potassium uptake protein [Clostridia bacterium]|nr:TrkH family potassium uptake protein [Clostridia bacterium]
MNYKMVLRLTGRLLMVEAAIMFIPFAVSIYCGDSISYTYLITSGLLIATGLLMGLPKPDSKRIYAREGFVMVSLAWILMSLFGALPFTLSGAIPSYIDAFFETVSGFTTTGASVLTDIEALPDSLLFWRSFTHWIGGMGVIVFVLAFLPQKEMQSMHIMRAEVPGPTVGKLVSKTRATARILYKIYTVMTVAEIIALRLCGFSFFDSITTALSTAGTGGFSVMNSSIAAYDNIAAEIVIAVFMFLFGINFNLFYLSILKQFKRAFKSEELWAYIGIIAISIVLITIDIYPLIGSVGSALRDSGFTVVSIVTTTGFITADYSQWPAFSQFIILLLLFTGACTGSTSGGLKVGRLIILLKSGVRQLKRAVNPQRVKCVRLDGAVLEEEVISSTSSYFLIYMLLIGVSSLIISLNDFDLITSLSSVITCINNVGPGFGSIGPVDNFSIFSDFSKIVLSLNMLVGRLEIFPMLVLVMPSTWKKSA